MAPDDHRIPMLNDLEPMRNHSGTIPTSPLDPCGGLSMLACLDIVQGHVLGNALKAKGRQIQGFVAAGCQQLGYASPDCGCVHDAVSAEATSKYKVVNFGMSSDDAVLIESVDLVMAGPRVNELDVFEANDSDDMRMFEA